MDKTGKEVDLNAVRILELLRDIELHSAELYQYFAEIYADNKEISLLWTKTHLEELNHAHQFVLAINMRKDNVFEGVNIDLYTAKNLLDVIKSVYDGVRKKKPSISDALRCAIKLEEKLADLHMNSVTQFADESYKALFTALMNGDRQHVEMLRNAFNKLLKTNK